MKILVLVPIFLSGSLIYLYREKIPDSGSLALGATVLVLVGLVLPVGQGPPRFLQTSLDLTAVFLAYPLIWLGIHLPFTSVGANNDYSYGIYIYAFPIQQLFVMWGLNKWGYWPYTLVTITAVIPLAVASWWLIEKHALKLKKVKFSRPFRAGSTGESTTSP
jgi:peptidoglycan/LPS O-acetylase OafA/YrhL